jgi:hypothetical protein
VDKGDGKVDYNLHNGFLNKLDNHCVPKGEIFQLIREAHTSKFAGHFGVAKTVSHLQMYVY